MLLLTDAHSCAPEFCGQRSAALTFIKQADLDSKSSLSHASCSERRVKHIVLKKFGVRLLCPWNKLVARLIWSFQKASTLCISTRRTREGRMNYRSNPGNLPWKHTKSSLRGLVRGSGVAPGARSGRSRSSMSSDRLARIHQQVSGWSPRSVL